MEIINISIESIVSQINEAANKAEEVRNYVDNVGNEIAIIRDESEIAAQTAQTLEKSASQNKETITILVDNTSRFKTSWTVVT